MARSELKGRIARLPRGLRTLAMQYLNRGSRSPRYGSVRFERNHPKLAVPKREKRDMAKLHKAGIPFRPLEKLFGLADNSGNNAQRCVKQVGA
jgi:hypothetical protein